MIKGVGTDIVSIKRIINIYTKWGNKFLHKILTDNEVKSCLKQSNIPQYLGSRFAAKEAVVKMLGTGFSQGVSWKDIEITNNLAGKPDVQLANHVKQIARKKEIKNIHISISHEKEYTLAVVIGED